MAIGQQMLLQHLFISCTLVVVSARLISESNNGQATVFPPSCNRIECPSFDVIDKGNGFVIRRYNSSEWMSTSAISDISFVNATRAGFLQLFDYIQGKNEYNEKIEMTAPVLTEVLPSDGPFCASSFVVSFYVPKKNQANPPPAQGLHLQKWGAKFIAVRQFGGFVSDDSIGQEAAALYSSLQDSNWASSVDKGDADEATSAYTVAQYNSPFGYTDRVNEIWLTLDVSSHNQESKNSKSITVLEKLMLPTLNSEVF